MTRFFLIMFIPSLLLAQGQPKFKLPEGATMEHVRAIQEIQKNYHKMPEIREAIAKALNMDPKSRRFSYLMDRNKTLPDAEYVPNKIIKHIKGTKGVKFGVMQDYLKEEDPIIEKTKQQLVEKMKNLKKEYKRATKKKDYSKANVFKKCKTSRTVTIHRNKGAKSKDSKYALSDMLFIQKDFDVADFKEVYGKRTKVYLTGTKKPKVEYFILKNFGVQCLPTRIIRTEKYLFRHEGFNSLKNFDGNFNGSGKAHIEARKFEGNFNGF